MSLLLLFAGGSKRPVGSSISGGTFSRGQWERIQSDLAKRRREEETRLAAEAQRKADARAAEHQAWLDARRSERESAKASGEATAAELTATNRRDALAHLLGIQQAATEAHLRTLAAHHAHKMAQDQEEEEAMVLLLSQ